MSKKSRPFNRRARERVRSRIAAGVQAARVRRLEAIAADFGIPYVKTVHRDGAVTLDFGQPAQARGVDVFIRRIPAEKIVMGWL